MTVKLRVLVGAGLYVASPSWSACTVQVPAETRVIVCPFVPPAVQTEGVVVENVIVKPDEAVATTVTGDWAMDRFASALKVMVWFSLMTLKLRVLVGAGL